MNLNLLNLNPRLALYYWENLAEDIILAVGSPPDDGARRPSLGAAPRIQRASADAPLAARESPASQPKA